MKLSLCITTYNRYPMCLESFKHLIDDDRIEEVIILDDASRNDCRMNLAFTLSGVKKIRLMTQLENVGMSRNKRDAIGYAKKEWVIILDDDNIADGSYVDALFALPGAFSNPNEIFIPDFARPRFDYKDFDNMRIGRDNVRGFFSNKIFGALLNTCNYVVNRDYYLRTWEYNAEMKATDTAWHAYNHLKSGGCFRVVPGMEYDHRIHMDSGFMQDVHYNMDKAKEIENLIKAL